MVVVAAAAAAAAVVAVVDGPNVDSGLVRLLLVEACIRDRNTFAF